MKQPKLKRIFLTSGTRCRNVETEKAYAIKLFRQNVFVSKKCCVMQKITHDRYRWTLDIPTWMIEKNEDLEDAVIYIEDLNEWCENIGKKTISKIDKYLSKYEDEE